MLPRFYKQHMKYGMLTCDIAWHQEQVCMDPSPYRYHLDFTAPFGKYGACM